MERTVDELLLAYHREGDKAARDQALLEGSAPGAPREPVRGKG